MCYSELDFPSLAVVSVTERQRVEVMLAAGETPSRDADLDELDLPPEYCHYRDEGCELAVSCLECPFPECIFELPGGKRRWLKGLRNREVVRLRCTTSEPQKAAQGF